MERPWREKEPPFGGCSFSLQTFLNLPELPHKTPAIPRVKICFAFLDGRGLVGKFWLGREVGIFEECGYRTRLAGGSAVGYDIQAKYILQMRPTHKTGAIAAPYKNTSPKTKNFPQEHPPKHSETNFRHIRAGALGESSRESGRFGGREPLFQEGLSPSKVFLPPRSSSLPLLSHSQSAPTVFLFGGKDFVAVRAETVLNIPAALHNDAGGEKNG